MRTSHTCKQNQEDKLIEPQVFVNAFALGLINR